MSIPLTLNLRSIVPSNFSVTTMYYKKDDKSAFFFLSMVRIFYMSDTSSETRQMNWRRILLMNLLNRRQRFDSDARRLTLKDTDQWVEFCKRRKDVGMM